MYPSMLLWCLRIFTRENARRGPNLKGFSQVRTNVWVSKFTIFGGPYASTLPRNFVIKAAGHCTFYPSIISHKQNIHPVTPTCTPGTFLSFISSFPYFKLTHFVCVSQFLLVTRWCVFARERRKPLPPELLWGGPLFLPSISTPTIK